MALRDTWHRTLVYFGLAEDEAYEDDYDAYSEPEVQLQDSYRERPTVRRLPQTLRPVAARPNRSSFHFVAPKNFNDVQDVGDKFKASIPVILNLQNADHDLSKRLIDFVSGLTYALDGGMQRIADKVFLLTPEGVQLSAEERASLASNDFFNQS
jgi:cell division inhibitor SepF